MSAQPVPQHLAALERANQIRLARVNARNRVRAGELTIRDALELDCCQSMKVFDLVRSQRRVGPTKATTILSRLAIGPYRRIEDLTPRQRNLVVLACEAHR